MNLLRAFGEHVGILTPAQDISAKTIVQDQPIGIASIEKEIPHCCFYCSWCGSEMLLPHDSLGYAFSGPMVRKIETRCIGTVCLKCNRVGVYSLFRGCPGYTTRHKFMQSRPEGRIMLLDWLPCVEKSCVFPVPFFVTFDDALSEQNVKERAVQWMWDDMTCSASHVVQPPKWLSEPGSYRRALELNWTHVNQAGAQRPG